MTRFLLSAPEVLRRMQQGERFFPVDATWYLNRPDLNPSEVFQKRRIPGAVRFELDEVCDKTTTLPHMLPGIPDMNAFIQSHKINRDLDQVLVYVQHHSFAAPRVFWHFRVFGFNAFVLDGGLEAWTAAGGPVVSGEAGNSQLPFHEDVPAVTSMDLRLVRSFEQMKNISISDSLVLDARPAGRFSGKDAEPRPGLARGHMPGSVNVPFTELLETSDWSKFRSRAEMAAVFRTRDVDQQLQLQGQGQQPRTIVSSCGSGVTACVVALALAEVAQPARDLASLPVYDGSWAEWGARTDTPKVLAEKE